MTLLRSLDWTWTLLGLAGLAEYAYLLRNGLLTRYWLRRLGINSHLLLVVTSDISRHLLGIVFFAIYIGIGVWALRSPSPATVMPAAVLFAAVFIFTELLMVAKGAIDAYTTYSLLNYHGISRKNGTPPTPAATA